MAPGAVTLLFVILMAAALMNGLHLPMAGRRIRPEHLAAPAVFATFVISQLVFRQRVVRIDSFSILATAWVVVNALSSWLFAPQPSESLVHVVRIGFLVGVFVTVANLPTAGAMQWDRRLRVWLVLGLAGLAYGVFIWFMARYADVWLPGAHRELGLSGISIQGTQYERNLFGILAATLMAVSVYGLFVRRRPGHLAPAPLVGLMTACVLAGIALVLSLTRSAWIAVIVASPMAYLLFDRQRLSRADRPLLQTMVALPVLLGGLFAAMQILPSPASAAAPRSNSTSAAETEPVAPSANSPTAAASSTMPPPVAHRLRPRLAPPVPPVAASDVAPAAPASVVGDRLSTLARLESDFTLSTRIEDARWAVDDWMASPVLGRGTGSFGQIHGIRKGTEAWQSNLILHTLVDTGLVGLAIQMTLLVLVAWRAWRSADVTNEPLLRIGLKAMTLGLVVMMVAYQVTEGTWLAVFWIHLALMVSGIYCVSDEQYRLAALRNGGPIISAGRL